MHTAILGLLCSFITAAPLPNQEIVNGADARIEQHRTGEAALVITGPDGGALPEGTAVKIEMTRHAFLFGSNIFKLDRCRTPEDNEAYAKHFADLLNFATLPFYWWGYEVKQGEPGHDRIDAIIPFCEKHGITTKGHPLVWNYVDPKWLPDDSRNAMTAQMARIEREMKRFDGHIDIWDVVNEATHYRRPGLVKAAPVLTKSIREQGVGPFVRQAFLRAREASPGATLIINDYAVEEDYAAKVLEELIDDEGRPLYDVIGIQSHQHGGAWPVERIWQVCDRFARFGKPLHFTETTFLSGQSGWDLQKARREAGDNEFKWASTPEGEERQARDVVTFYTTLFSHPSVEAITWWDFSDQDSWQQAPAGFLREDMTPKPAYHELKKLIKGKWWTTTQATADAGGKATFHGYFGDYRVRVATPGGEFHGRFRFDRATKQPIEVKVEARVKAAE